MANIRKLYEADQTTQLMPQTHEKAVIDNNGTTAETKFRLLQEAYSALTQSDIVVVADHTAVASPQANAIYREQGTTTYSDWMYYDSSWKKMAEYDNAIDDVPTKDSNNLVKSGGVYNAVAETNELINGKISYVMKSDVKTDATYHEHYIEGVKIVSGHSYKITMKSDALLASSGSTDIKIVIANNTPQITVGTANTIYQQGVTLQFTANASGTKSIYQYSPANAVANVNVHMEIEDVTEPTSIGPFHVESSEMAKTLAKAKMSEMIEESCNYKILYTRSLANNQLSYSGFQPSTVSNGKGSKFYVSMKDTLALPYRSVRIYLKAPDDITARVIIRPWNASEAAISSTTISNGGYVDADASGLMYIVEFHRRGDGLTPQELYDYMDNGLLMLYYHDDSGNVVVRNSDAMRYVNAIKGDGEVIRDYTTFVHGTDIHGDDVRLHNILRFADLVKPDATILSGDHVAIGIDDGIDFFNEALPKYRYINPFICIGNHDVNDINNATAYTKLVAPFATDLGWMKDAENVTDKCWFYKDLTSKNIRLISLDMYEYGRTRFYKVFYSQEQITWFINTLMSVPEGYGVVIVMHSMEALATAISGKEAWWANVSSSLDYGGITGGYVIQDIVDAWIGKTTINKTYSQSQAGGGTNTFTAQADFSEDVANEFICYISGHTHADCIGYAASTAYRQLVMCCTCAIPWRGQTGRAYPRGLQGVTQDSFNVYAIDRTNKQVRIAKVGSNMKLNFTETKYTIVDYENIPSN